MDVTVSVGFGFWSLNPSDAIPRLRPLFQISSRHPNRPERYVLDDIALRELGAESIAPIFQVSEVAQTAGSISSLGSSSGSRFQLFMLPINFAQYSGDASPD